MASTDRKVIGLFPTPLMLAPQAIPGELVAQLAGTIEAASRDRNASDDLLSHTRMMDPDDDALFARVAAAALGEVERFGALLFGDRLAWQVKEMWMNALEPGGSQFMHTHANSFVSGIVYLTRPHASTRTVFMRPSGGAEFIFRHDAPADGLAQFNADRWVLPDVSPGDLVLYPSYVMHGVPPNGGQRRLSLAFNAIPEKLTNFDYAIRFSR